jgi:predicted DCC family thiol-disulfide oxidoreductase YuxK
LIAADYIIFYDGNCGFCSRSIRLLHSLDQQDRIHFAPLGGETALLYNITSASMADTSILLRLSDRQQFEKSSAALQCLCATGGIVSWVATLLSCVPVRLRDCLYDLIARHRLRFFTPYRVCDIPDSQLQKKLLP